MTKVLDQAMEEVARLPETEQDRIARLILEELRAEGLGRAISALAE